MKTEKGHLVKKPKDFMVRLPTKKGMADFAIPMSAKQFSDADAADGLEVDVERDSQNRITKVTIPGKAIVRAPERPTKVIGPDRRTGPQGSFKSSFESRDTSKMAKAPPSVLELPFHNPYTFIPFPRVAAERRSHTLHSADETGGEQRYTGILQLEVVTQSPLLTMDPTPLNSDGDHKQFRALCIGNDVIVPATSIRGALRSLLTILAGTSLGYLNTRTFLCQGRDVNLGPRGLRGKESTPAKCFLAEVERPGNARRDGTILLGVDHEPVLVTSLEKAFQGKKLDEFRNADAKTLWALLGSRGEVERVFVDGTQPRDADLWKIKLSGRVINSRGKREGLFRPNGIRLEVPARYWEEYSERNKHAGKGGRPELRKGDLIWLMPSDPNLQSIESIEDIESLQWSRWGRRGQSLQGLIAKKHQHVLPDHLRGDGKVDFVTNLFGQVQSERDATADVFAARVLPENVVFFDAKSSLTREKLAPLMPPHPGCLAFYRKQSNVDQLSTEDELAGYKVYRTTKEREAPPWRFEVQGVYGDRGQLDMSNERVTKTVEILPEGQRGFLNISFLALTKKELSLLIQACRVPWRLGGGKPLGLGACRVDIVAMLDENGQPFSLDNWEQEVLEWRERVELWSASQNPVERLRYPRAVERNTNKLNRGGHAWFGRHAKTRASTNRDDSPKPGLEPMYLGGKFLEDVRKKGVPLDQRTPMISGQLLPQLDARNQEADLLFGYDGYASEVVPEERPRRNVVHNYEAFDPKRHVKGDERSGGNDGNNRERRNEDKDRS